MNKNFIMSKDILIYVKYYYKNVNKQIPSIAMIKKNALSYLIKLSKH